MENFKLPTPLETVTRQLDAAEKEYDKLTQAETKTMTAVQKAQHCQLCQKKLAEKFALRAARNKHLKIDN